MRRGRELRLRHPHLLRPAPAGGGAGGGAGADVVGWVAAEAQLGLHLLINFVDWGDLASWTRHTPSPQWRTLTAPSSVRGPSTYLVLGAFMGT